MHAARDRAESFGGVAEDYDRYRPSYPADLIADLVHLGGRDMVDVGCGTGKAATLFAAKGMNVLGVEADARMAGVARAHGLTVEVASFESWDAAGRTFDLITSAQAWHWVDPEVGVPKAAALLRPGGALALFWNHSKHTDPPQSVFEAVYAQHAPELLAQANADKHRLPTGGYVDALRASGLFASVQERHYKRIESYTPEQWVGLVNTHSDHLALDPARRAALSEGLRAAFRRVDVAVGTYLVLARVPGGR